MSAHRACSIKLQPQLQMPYAPSSNKKEFTAELNAIFEQLELHKSNNYNVLAGDLNAKHTDWHNKTNNNRGRTLKKWLKDNEIQHRVTLINTLLPSYPTSGSFIDICLTDNRIKYHRLPAPGRLNSRDYDSDHRATEIIITLDSDDPLLIDEPTETSKYNFNKADWHDFQKDLLTRDNTQIPNTRNLTIVEIDNYIDTLNASINAAIDNTIPRISNDYNSTDRYITPTIKNLKKLKSILLIRLNRMTAVNNYTTAYDTQIELLKYTLKTVRIEIKKAFHRSVSDSNTELLANANIDSKNTQKDEEDNLIISVTYDKLNILGAQFERAHTQNHSMGKPRLTDIITQKINTLKTEIVEDRRNNITVCTFSDTNKADNPNTDETPTDFFTSTFDNILNIILKHLPPRFIYNYAIIFNNCLNRAQFPAAWKTAKTICLKKKTRTQATQPATDL
ncbi:uncharacterized protein LOC143363333 [Halictus rubicundus]|uniref:uncharacterized protein LOC143363333 n=1 Tax=Halictus rubicundus TaxID=77578 RepID=UPI00403561E4